MKLQGKVTHKASSAALNKLVYDTNRLGGHLSLLVHALIPAESEFICCLLPGAWQAFSVAARIALLLPACCSPDCKTCATIAQILDNPNVSAFFQFTKWHAVAQVR